jgi:acyl carrier protein
VENVAEVKTIPIGKAIANTQIYLLDNYLNPVPVGVTGEIYIGGDGLAHGYFNRPELTAKQFIANPYVETNAATSLHCATLQRLYKTGDFARYLPDGNLEFIGRKDDLVKLRGFRIELGEVETVLNQHPKVRESIVVVKEENLVAYIVASVQLKSSELKEFLQVKLPNYSIPAVFVFLDGLPLTLNGKVDRLALPTPDFTQNISDKTPRNSVEAELVQLWNGLLGVQLGISDNFFELGGHSLLATQLVSRIRESFGVQVPLKRVFETPTIAGLAEYITSSKNVTSKIREEVKF